MSWDVQTHSGDACCDMMSLLHQLSHCQHCQHAGNYVALSFDYSLLSKDTHTQIVTRTHIHSVTHTHTHTHTPAITIINIIHLHHIAHTTFDGFVTCTTVIAVPNALPNACPTHSTRTKMHTTCTQFRHGFFVGSRALPGATGSSPDLSVEADGPQVTSSNRKSAVPCSVCLEVRVPVYVID